MAKKRSEQRHPRVEDREHEAVKRGLTELAEGKGRPLNEFADELKSKRAAELLKDPEMQLLKEAIAQAMRGEGRRAADVFRELRAKKERAPRRQRP